MTSILKRKAVASVDYLRTGSTQLDMAISCNKSQYGGIPSNCIVEFSGTGASGKTYICGELCGDAIRKKYDVHVDDIERRWDLDRLDTFGFSKTHPNFFYRESPSVSIEECFARMFDVIDKSTRPFSKKEKQVQSKILYIVDPIAALYANQELKSDKMGQARAKALQKHLRFLKDRVSIVNNIITIVFSNQLIDAVGVTFGPKKVTPGGNALIHWPSVRVRFSSPGRIYKRSESQKGKKKDENDKGKKNKDDELQQVVMGVKLRGEVTKNSEDDAFRRADFTIQYGYGIDDIYDNVKWLKLHTKELGDAPGYYKLPLDPSGTSQHGINNFVTYIEDNDLEKKLASLVRKHYRLWYKPEQRKPRIR